ncbi:MAG: CDP-diacylglycerol--serine O-phosphatidyltransferase [Bacteroidales bacterium]|nr:CDP-diacylglycerol--serine O-phosphatidyltransferase [Bacteroidales bacterium]
MKKIIPNTITCLNLVCGACAVILALWQFYYPAFLFLIAATCFDFCDGAAARALGVSSPIGKELDSLADVVSFGLAPALIFFSWYFYNIETAPKAFAFVSLMFAAFSAIRLAKFNLDDRQTDNFIGIPTPTAAMLISSMTAYAAQCKEKGMSSIILNLMNSSWFIPVFAVIISFMLISELPLFSMKHKKMSFKKFPLETICVIVSAVIIVASLIAWRSVPLSTMLTFMFYVAMNILAWFFPKKVAK